MEGEGCGWSAISQPTCENKKAFWFCLSFLGLWMEKADSVRLVENQASLFCGGTSRTCLEGQDLKFLLREGTLHQSNMLPAQDLCMQ